MDDNETPQQRRDRLKAELADLNTTDSDSERKRVVEAALAETKTSAEVYEPIVKAQKLSAEDAEKRLAAMGGKKPVVEKRPRTDVENDMVRTLDQMWPSRNSED